MRWVLTDTIDLDKLPQRVISGRFGSSVMFVYYSKFLRQWEWVCGGGVEKISQPQMLFLDENWTRKNRNLNPIKAPIMHENSGLIRKKKLRQLQLDLT